MWKFCCFSEGPSLCHCLAEKEAQKSSFYCINYNRPCFTPVTVLKKQNDSQMADVSCPDAVKTYDEKMQGVDQKHALCVEYSAARMARQDVGGST